MANIKKQYHIGYDIESKRGSYKLNFPIAYDMIINWDDIENIWNHSFTEELRVVPEEHNIIVTEPRKNCSNFFRNF